MVGESIIPKKNYSFTRGIYAINQVAVMRNSLFRGPQLGHHTADGKDQWVNAE
jgi:hypothetical protein